MAVSALSRSPHVRGRPDTWDAASAAAGSIPACAGETRTAGCGHGLDEVDPRVCGGDGRSFSRAEYPAGRSPRVRGRLFTQSSQLAAMRSIPACAGETCASITRCGWCRVDPRVCGGDGIDPTEGERIKGRSPRGGGDGRSALPCKINEGRSPRVRGRPAV